MRIFTQPEGWLILACFGALSFALSYGVLHRRQQDKTEFLLASRRVGWKASSLSIAATWIWAPALFVAAQQGYEHGWVGVFWFTVPNVACLVIFGLFMKRARRMFPRGFTASDMARQGYSVRVQRLYLAALLGLAACAFAVQLLAGGIVVSALTGIPFLPVTLALTVIALSYSLISGLMSSVITDYMQMVAIAGLGLGLGLAVAFAAGWSTVAAGLTGVHGDYSSLIDGPGAALFWSFGLSTIIGLTSGPFGDQAFWQRGWAARDGQVVRSFVGAAAVFAVVPVVMALLGFAAAGAGLTVDNAQLTNLAAVLHWLPEWTAVPFLLYIFAGLCSTLDSVLCAVSSLAGHDLARGSEQVSLRRARLAMVGIAVLGVGIANVPGIAIVQLFIFYGTLRACTMMPTMLMLIWRRTVSERGAFYGIVASVVVGVPLSAYGNLAGNTPMIVAASLAAIGLSGGGVVIGTLAEQRRGVGGRERPTERPYEAAAAAVDGAEV